MDNIEDQMKEIRNADTKDLFTGKMDDYSRYRPGYPQGIIQLLEKHASLTKDSVVADIGSGTGILSALFLHYGNMVFSVEPNRDMTARARRDLSGFPGFHPVDGTAENTGIEDGLIDIIVAGQSFHWFNREKAATEFRRILKPGGNIALIWNDRIPESTGMNADYERICKAFSPRYHGSGSSSVGEPAISEFFNGNYSIFILENAQSLDLEGIKGRYFSASYAIGKGDPDYDRLNHAFEDAFEKNRVGNTVQLRYETRIYLGKL